MNFWNALTKTIGDLLSRTLAWVSDHIEAHAADFVLALFTLFLGWVLAITLRKFTSKGLRAIGLDAVAERAGLRQLMEARGISVRPSIIVGWVVSILILYTALLMAVERLPLDAVHLLLLKIAEIVPKVLVVALLLGVAWMVGGWLGQAVRQTARLAGTPFYPLLGGATRVGVILFSVIIGLDYLGLASTVILLSSLGIIAVISIFASLVVAFCARELVQNIVSRSFVVSLFKPGQTVKVGELSGMIDSIGATSVKIILQDGIETFIPNSVFIEQPVSRIPEGR